MSRLNQASLTKCQECRSVIFSSLDYPRHLCGRCSVARDKKKSKDKRNLAYFRTMFKKVKKENKQLKEELKKCQEK